MVSPLSCPDDGELAAFVDGLLPGPAREAVEIHLDGCASCRETIGHVAVAAQGQARRLGRYRRRGIRPSSAGWRSSCCDPTSPTVTAARG